MTYPCPYCRSTAEENTGCPGCGRGPDPYAMAVIRADAEIASLNVRMTAAQQGMAALERELARAWNQRNEAAAAVRQRVAAGPPMTPPLPSPLPVVPPPVPPLTLPPRRTREASTRLVQNALFLLGGLLLAVAAIVFTAVAWSQFGVGGRAVLLAGFTALALAVPLLVRRRGLTATAETFAAVGLLLVVLDGYAAWYVDLFGVAAHSPYGYAGAVAAVTTAVAAGYQRHTGLTGPRFAALVAAQPILPLLVTPLHPDAAGWSFTLSAVALVNLAVARLRLVTLTAYGLGLLSCVAAAAGAVTALAEAGRPGPAAAGGAALIAAAALPVAGTRLGRYRRVEAYAAAVFVIAVGAAAGRVAALAGGRYSAVLVAAVMAVLALTVSALTSSARAVLALTSSALTSSARAVSARAVSARAVSARAVSARGAVSALPVRSLRAGVMIVAALPALFAVGGALRAADGTVRLFHAGVGTAPGDWRTLATLALFTVAAAALFPRWIVLPAGATLMAATVPAALGRPWSSAVAVDLLAAAVALVLAVRPFPVRPARLATSLRLASPLLAGAAVVLAGHAGLVGVGRAALATATFAALIVLGAGTAAAARRRPDTATLGGVALAVAFLAVPALAASAAAAQGEAAPVRAWLVLGAVAVLVGALHLVARAWPGYRTAAAAGSMLAAAAVPVSAILAGQPVTLHAGIALVLVALALPVAGPVAAGLAAVPLGVTALAGAAPGLFSVLVLPLGWIGRIWAGHPDGTGLDPFGLGRVTAAEVTGLVAAGVAGAVAARRAAVRVVLPVLVWAVPMALAAAGAGWPVVPLASAAIGLSALVFLAASGTGGFGAAGAGAEAAGAQAAGAQAVGAQAGRQAAGTRAGRVALAVAAFPVAAAGIAGSLPTRATTLAVLGAVVVAGTVVAMAGRTAGWLAAAPAAYGFAVTAGRMADLPLRTVAFVVLGTAAVVLAVGVARRATAVLEPAAHAGALLALLLTIGSARYAAAVLALWGLAVAVRALRSPVRLAHGVAAAALELGGWWLLLVSASVAVLEAYTVPAAAVALLAGTLALRTRPTLSSWTTHGPALAAALLPTLASVLTGDGHPLRRLLLGAGALVVVLAGAYTRRRAPVVLGGAVLALVALHELVLVWDLLPRWIPLAAGGLLLVGLAMTLERRRRDLARFRAALTRMS